MAAQSTVPVVPRTRPAGVSEVLRLLVNDAEQRIKAAVRPKFKSPQPTAVVQGLWREHRRNAKRNKRIEKRLVRAGFQVSYGGQLASSDSRESRQRQAWENQQAARKALLRSLRTTALIDLMGMPAHRAKQYIKALQKKLAVL